MSLASVKLDGGLSEGLTLDKVVGAVEMLISAHDPIGLVYGAGFEHQPETIAAIAQQNTGVWQWRGYPEARQGSGRARAGLRGEWRSTSADCVCAAGRARALAHEEAGRRRRRPYRHGGSRELRSPDSYFQRRVAGKSISALFLASEKKAEIIGLSMQWTAPTPASPFRYGGAAGPVDIDPAQAEEIARSVAVIASELDLVGLNSADFLVSADAVWLIEINPRPGATLDVFESNEAPLFARHIAACEGRLTPASPSFAFKAAEIVYAPHDIVVRRRGGIGRIGRSIDRRRERASPPAIPCARCLALARPSIWREPAPASGRGKSSLSFRRRTIERCRRP